MKIDNYDYY